MDLLAIYWNVSPVLMHIGEYGLRWYTLFFAAGFFTGAFMLSRFFRKEGIPQDKLLLLLFLLLVCVVVGLRLGQCIFYNPRHFFGSWEGFLDIFRIWKGGMACHGGIAGVMLGTWWFTARYGKSLGIDYLWMLDRILIAAPFWGAIIRVGNFFNSEIYGPVTDLPWGVVFELKGQTVPHHPTQLYEAVAYLLIGLLLLWLYNHRLDKLYRGYFSGLCGITVFGSRFLLEFVKTVKVFVNLGFTTITLFSVNCL